MDDDEYAHAVGCYLYEAVWYELIDILPRCDSVGTS